MQQVLNDIHYFFFFVAVFIRRAGRNVFKQMNFFNYNFSKFPIVFIRQFIVINVSFNTGAFNFVFKPVLLFFARRAKLAPGAACPTLPRRSLPSQRGSGSTLVNMSRAKGSAWSSSPPTFDPRANKLGLSWRPSPIVIRR